MSKKSIFLIIILILGATIAISIGNSIINNDNKENSNNEQVEFTATVLENKGASLIVEPGKDEDELRSSNRISVRVPQDGAVLKDLSGFTVGSKVKITYDGLIMESYPAQINAYEVEFADNQDETNNDTINDNAQIEYELTEEGAIKPEFAKRVIEETANKLIKAISTKDSETISEFVHPVKGLRFTPYTHVLVDNDVVFNHEEIKTFFTDQNVFIWGYYDGKGDEISLTPSKYYDEFIYSDDFINAEKIGYNEMFSSGNMVENQYEIYENAIVVEYYFSGFNPDYGGADWKSLRLVFEQYEDDWKLVGIIHNQWTT